ncbi:MAG: hypothetical protein GF411_13075 [Candidatus Lokiarchaeota archaeon]|nr:hypothetical protein [Candidatus Lokiarchaeota archaeon]
MPLEGIFQISQTIAALDTGYELRALTDGIESGGPIDTFREALGKQEDVTDALLYEHIHISFSILSRYRSIDDIVKGHDPR